MEDSTFDDALITAAFALAAKHGWRHVSVAEAARTGNVPLERARSRFPGRGAILLRFGVLADQAALEAASGQGSVRDALFDMLMRRFDAMQPHRAGILALLHDLPTRPQTALLLAVATRRSMRWMLEAAGLDTSGVSGALHVRGAVAVWLWALRTWRTDETTDLSATMATLDEALQRAEQAASWLPSAARRPDQDRSVGQQPEQTASEPSASSVPAAEAVIPQPPISDPPEPFGDSPPVI